MRGKVYGVSESAMAATRRAEQANYINHPTVAFKQMHRLAADVHELAASLESVEADLSRYREYTQALAATLVAERMDRWGQPTPPEGAYPLGRKVRGLDLFCGAGGATRGYQMAGFEMTGVDIKPQPRYAGERFFQADALEFVAEHGRNYDFIHASPPCQHYANVTAWRGSAEDHPDLVSATRDALQATGRPWVMENVMEAPMRRDYILCGSHLD